MWRDVKFSLTYDGELLSATDKHSRNKNKNEIRYELSKQLYEVWILGDFERFQLDEKRMYEVATNIHELYFVPLLARKMNASCHLSIKFMRAEHPGSIVHGGDLDNRLKVLLDALRMPQNNSEVLPNLVPAGISYLEPEHPCVCLLEDDSLVTNLSVDTVRILTPLPRNHVRLVMDIEFKPLDFSM